MDSDRQRPPTPASLRTPWSVPQLPNTLSYCEDDASALTSLDAVARNVKTVLFVHPVIELRQAAHDLLKGVAHITLCSTFADARSALCSEPPHLLVTGVRLRAHNGLHLVYLASMRSGTTRSLVFADVDDYPLARDVHEAGAFFVPAHSLLAALKSYVGADLPPFDRRDAIRPRRSDGRDGGRRCTDK
jgi:hypothetical protein